MMKDVIIKISGDSQVYLNKKTLGISGENLQGNIVFQFTNEFVNGIAWLETEMPNGEKGYLECYKKDNEYYLPILSSLLKQVGNITMQLRITKDENINGIPIFKSNKFYLEVKEAINSITTIPEEYPQWIDIANAKIIEIDESLNDMQEVKSYVTEQTDYAKETADNLNRKLNNGELNGATFIPNLDEEGNLSWTNNKNLENPQVQNIRGPQGVMGPQGEAFKIKKTYTSKEKMIADFDNMEVGDYVMITSNIEVEDNAKLYSKGETEWVFITDFSGATGIQGPQGPQGIQGIQGVQGPKGDKPIKGVDYFTETEKDAMVSEITDNANSVFNQNVNEKTNEFNANAETKVNEFNETVDSLQEEIDDLYNNQLFSEASGESIYITDSANAKVSHLEIEGNSYQKTTSGKQLFNFESAKNEISSRMTFTGYAKEFTVTRIPPNTDGFITLDFEETKTYTISGLISSSALNGSIALNYSDGTNLVVYEGYSNSNINEIPFSVTTDSQKTISNIRFSTFSNNDFTLKDFCINEGTEKIPFEEYTGGIASPNPDYPSEVEVIEGNIGIKTIGKNLLPNNATNQTMNGVTFTKNNDGSITINGTSTSVIKYQICNAGEIQLEPNDYILSSKNNIPSSMWLTFRSHSVDMIALTNKNVGRFTLTKNSVDGNVYIYISSGVTVNNLTIYPMVRIANITDDTYEPYKEEITYIDLQGNFVGKLPDGTKDRLYIKNNHLYLEKKIKKRILDGSEELTLDGSSNGIYQFSFTVLDIKVKTDQQVINVISDYFKGVVWANSWTQDNAISSMMNIRKVRLYTSKFATIEELKTWLSENNVTIYYELAEPQIIDLGYIKTPKTLEKTSNISLLANLETNMSLKYVQHTKTILDNIQNQINNIMTATIPLDGEVE